MGRTINTIIKQRKKLTIAHGAFEFQRQLLVQLLSGHTVFQIDILWQPGDGFVVLDVESGSDLVPLDDCIRIIEEEGTLTRKEFKNHCI